MTTMTFFEADGVEFAVDVEIEVGADLMDLVGCFATVKVEGGGGAGFDGVATVTGPTRVLCAFAAPAGFYHVQVRVTPPVVGHLGQTVSEHRVAVKRSF